MTLLFSSFIYVPVFSSPTWKSVLWCFLSSGLVTPINNWLVISAGFNGFLTLKASLLFAFGEAFADVAKTSNLPIPQQFLSMIPYILTLLALIGFVGRARAPKASGQPYEK